MGQYARHPDQESNLLIKHKVGQSAHDIAPPLPIIKIYDEEVATEANPQQELLTDELRTAI